MSISQSLNGLGGGSAFLETRRRYTRNLRVYYLFHAASGFLIWLPIWMIYLIDGRGMSLTQVALMETIFWVALVIAEVPTGAIADRWGRRTSLFLGGCGFTIASVAFAFSSTYPMLAASYAIMAVSMTLYSGAGHALLFDTLRQLGRTNEYEKHVGRSDAAAFAAMLIATLLGGPITALVGFSNTILIGAAALATAAGIALLLREPPRREAEIAAQPGGANGRHGGGNGATPGVDAPAAQSVVRNMLMGAFTVWRRKALLAIIIFATLMMVVFEMPEFFLQTFVRFQGVDPQAGLDAGFAYSGLIIPPIAGMVIGSLLAASVAGRFGERRALPVVLLGGLLLFVPLMLWDSLWVIAAVALVAVLRGMIRPIATGYINRRIASDQRATVLSMYELSMGVLMALSTPLVGSVADNLSFQWAFALCLAALLVGGGLLAVIWRRAHGREQVRNGIALNSAPAPQAGLGGAANGRNGAVAAASTYEGTHEGTHEASRSLQS